MKKRKKENSERRGNGKGREKYRSFSGKKKTRGQCAPREKDFEHSVGRKKKGKNPEARGP